MTHRAGKHRNITFSAVTKIVGRLAARMKEDLKVRKEVEILEKELSTVKGDPSSIGTGFLLVMLYRYTLNSGCKALFRIMLYPARSSLGALLAAFD
jgi:hypothetical protein